MRPVGHGQWGLSWDPTCEGPDLDNTTLHWRPHRGGSGPALGVTPPRGRGLHGGALGRATRRGRLRVGHSVVAVRARLVISSSRHM